MWQKMATIIRILLTHTFICAMELVKRWQIISQYYKYGAQILTTAALIIKLCMQLKEHCQSVLSLKANKYQLEEQALGHAYLNALCLKIVLRGLMEGHHLNKEQFKETVKKVSGLNKEEDLNCAFGRLYLGLDTIQNVNLLACLEKQLMEALFQAYKQEYSQFQMASSEISNQIGQQVSNSQSFPFVLQVSQIAHEDKDSIEQQAFTTYPSRPVADTALKQNPLDMYLSGIPVFRSQINLLSQFMKLPPVKYYRFKQGDCYYVQACFEICCSFTGYHRYEFMGQGWSAIYKHACDQAAYQVLRQLYARFPNLWARFVTLKTRKGLY